MRYMKTRRLAKLGSGKRFAALEASFAGRRIQNPGALAAKIGARKWGRARMTRLALAGKRRAARAAG